MNIEIFPCAGGMAEGFRRAGVVFDMAIELVEDHCESYERNLGHRPLQMDARSILYMLQDGWRPPRPVSMLVADPPCTPWSRSGKRLGTNDPRDMLEGTCRIIALLRPSVYVIGNVPGLDDGPNLGIVQRTIGALSNVGYCTADFTRLDAANYGVPQHRIRPFWFGHMDGPCIQWPAPTHCDPELATNYTLPGVGELVPWVTCRQALGHLPVELRGRPIRLRKRNSNSKQHGSVEERPARTVGTSNLSDGNVLLPLEAPRAGKRGGRKRQGQGNRVGDIDTPSATITAKPPRRGAGAHSVLTIQPTRGTTMSADDAPAQTITRNTHGNGSVLIRASDGEGVNRALEWPWDRPSVTVQCDERLPPPGHHDEDYNIMSLPWGIVISELAATVLQGFPYTLNCRCSPRQVTPWSVELEHTGTAAKPGALFAVAPCPICKSVIDVVPWVFVGKTKRIRFSQIGQAMPPPLAYAVASSVVAQIKATKGRSSP